MTVKKKKRTTKKIAKKRTTKSKTKPRRKVIRKRNSDIMSDPDIQRELRKLYCIYHNTKMCHFNGTHAEIIELLRNIVDELEILSRSHFTSSIGKGY